MVFNKCKIYNERPEVCKRFGDESHPALCCPYQDKNGRVRSRAERRYTERQIDKFIPNLKKKLLSRSSRVEQRAVNS